MKVVVKCLHRDCLRKTHFCRERERGLEGGKLADGVTDCEKKGGGKLPLGFTVNGWADWAAQSNGAGKLIVSKTASAMNHENDPCEPP